MPLQFQCVGILKRCKCYYVSFLLFRYSWFPKQGAALWHLQGCSNLDLVWAWWGWRKSSHWLLGWEVWSRKWQMDQMQQAASQRHYIQVSFFIQKQNMEKWNLIKNVNARTTWTFPAEWKGWPNRKSTNSVFWLRILQDLENQVLKQILSWLRTQLVCCNNAYGVI